MIILFSFRDRVLLGSPGWPWAQAIFPALPSRVLGLPPRPANMKHFNFPMKGDRVLERRGVSWQYSFLSHSDSWSPALGPQSWWWSWFGKGGRGQTLKAPGKVNGCIYTDKGFFLLPATDARISVPSQEAIVNAAAESEW